jgi:hypothetical protein
MAAPPEPPSPSEPRGITDRGGRPRQHADRAARQRAYRERLRAKAAAYDALPREVKEAAVPGAAAGKSKTGRELLAALEAEGVIGVWADRKDIGDSVEFARQLRERAWTRPHEG